MKHVYTHTNFDVLQRPRQLIVIGYYVLEKHC